MQRAWCEVNFGDEFPLPLRMRNKSSSKVDKFKLWLFGIFGSLLLSSHVEVVVFFLLFEVSVFKIGTRHFFEVGNKGFGGPFVILRSGKAGLHISK